MVSASSEDCTATEAIVRTAAGELSGERGMSSGPESCRGHWCHRTKAAVVRNQGKIVTLFSHKVGGGSKPYLIEIFLKKHI